MKKSAQKKSKKIVKKSQGLVWKNSPLVLGLKGLIPVLMVGVFVGAGVKAGAEGLGQRVGGMDKAEDHLEIARKAAVEGDLVLAQKEYRLAEAIEGGVVLGASSDLEELVWPEEAIKRKIEKLKIEAEETESSKLLIEISQLYWKLSDKEGAAYYWSKAWSVDPNDQEVNNWGRIVNR